MWIKLCAEDQQQFAEAPEWVEFSDEAFVDLPASKLIVIEDAMGMSFASLATERGGHTALAAKALTWLARRLAGVDERFATFDPRVNRISWRVRPPGEAGDDPAEEREDEERDPPVSPPPSVDAAPASSSKKPRRP